MTNPRNFVLCCFLFILFNPFCFPEFTNQELADKYNNSLLEVYFDKADLQTDREKWLRIVENGVEVTIASWENAVLLLAGENNDFPALKTQLEDEINQAVEQRLTDWLVRHFFEELDSADISSVLEKIKEANIQYLYVTDIDGNIVRDSTGDPVLYSEENIDEDADLWHKLVKTGIDDVMSLWDEYALVSKTELLDDIPAGSESVLNETININFSLYQDGMRRELDRIFLQEENAFIQRRLNDQYSLRMKNEGETAASIVERLINETEGAVENGIKRLEQGLENAGIYVGTDAVDVDPEEWLESFKLEFEKGLERWENAEKQLLLERVAWERQAGKDFRDGEKSWAEALKQLSQASYKWEAEISALVIEGQQVWDEKEQALQTALEQAALEYKESIQERKSAVSIQIKNMMDMYMQSVNMVVTAQNSIDFWTEKIASTTLPDKIAFGNTELAYWNGVKDTYTSYRDWALEELGNTYGVALGESIDINAVSQGDAWQSVLLDEYQIELVAAKGELNYWNRELEIAQAVYDYAIDTSSGRETEAGTKENYEAALSAFEAAQTNYNNAVAMLDGIGTGLADERKALDDVKAVLDDAREDLEAAQAEYQRLYEFFMASGDDHYKQKIQDYYKELCELKGIITTDGVETIGRITNDYLLAARRYGLEEVINLGSKELDKLVNGSMIGLQKFPSLHELRRTAEKLSGDLKWSDDAVTMEAMLSVGGIPATDPYYSVLIREYANYKNALTVGNNEAAFYKLKIIALFDQIKSSAERALSQREEAIDFLTIKDMDDWIALSGTPGTTVEGILNTINKDADEAQGAFLLKKAQLISSALNLIISGSSLKFLTGTQIVSDITSITSYEDRMYAQAFLAQFADTNIDATAQAAAWIASIRKIITLLSGPGGLSISGNIDAIKALADSDILVKEFFNRQGGILNGEYDLADAILFTDLAAFTKKAENQMTVEMYKNTAPCMRTYALDNSLDQFSAWLADNGLSTGIVSSQLVLKSPDAVYSAITGSGGTNSRQEIETFLNNLAGELDTLPDGLPSYVIEGLYDYTTDLAYYFAVKILKEEMDGVSDLTQWHENQLAAGSTLTAAISNITLSTEVIKEKLTEIDKLNKSIQYAGDNTKALLILYEGFGSNDDWDSLEGETIEWKSQIETALAKSFSHKLALRMYGNYAIAKRDVVSFTADFEAGFNEIIQELFSTGTPPVIPETLMAAIIAGAESLYNSTLVLEQGLYADWDAISNADSASGLSPETALLCKASLWNENDPLLYYYLGSGMDGTLLQEMYSIREEINTYLGDGSFDAAESGEILLDYLYGGLASSYTTDGVIDSLADYIQTVPGNFNYNLIDRDFIDDVAITPLDATEFYFTAHLKNEIDSNADPEITDAEILAQVNAEIDTIVANTADAASVKATIQGFFTTYTAATPPGIAAWSASLRNILGIQVFDEYNNTAGDYTIVAKCDFLCEVIELLQTQGLSIAGSTEINFNDILPALFGTTNPDASVLMQLDAADTGRDAVLSDVIDNLDADALDGLTDGATREFGLQVRLAQMLPGAAFTDVVKTAVLDQFRQDYIYDPSTPLSGNPAGIIGFINSLTDYASIEEVDSAFSAIITLSSPYTQLADLSILKQEAGVYERALFMGLTDSMIKGDVPDADISPACNWVLDINNIDGNYNHIDVTGTGSDDVDITDAMLWSYDASAGGVEYYIKKCVLNGIDPDNLDLADYQTEYENAEGFLEQVQSVQSYIPGLDADVMTYAGRETDPSPNNVCDLASWILLSVNEDSVYTPGMTGNAGISYLNLIGDYRNTGSANLFGLFGNIISEEMASGYSDMNGNALYKQYLDNQKNTLQAWLNSFYITNDGQAEKPGFNFRMALINENLDDGSAGPDDLVSLETGSAASNDYAPAADTIYHIARASDSSGYKNEELDRFNETLLAQEYLLDCFSAANEELNQNQTDRSAVFNAYFTAANGLLAIDTEADLRQKIINIQASSAISTNLNELKNKVMITESRIEDLKDGICSAVETFEMSNLAWQDYKDQIAPKLADIENLRAIYEETQETYLDRLDAFNGVNNQYQAAQENIQAALGNLEEERYELQKCQELLEYAESLYLNPDGDTEDALIIDPDEKLEYVELQQYKAQQIYNILYNLHTDSYTENDSADEQALNTAFTDYTDSYNEYVYMEEAYGLLSDIIEKQEVIVDNCTNEKFKTLSTDFFSFAALSDYTDNQTDTSALAVWKEADAFIEAMYLMRQGSSTTFTNTLKNWGFAYCAKNSVYLDEVNLLGYANADGLNKFPEIRSGYANYLDTTAQSKLNSVNSSGNAANFNYFSTITKGNDGKLNVFKPDICREIACYNLYQHTMPGVNDSIDLHTAGAAVYTASAAALWVASAALQPWLIPLAIAASVAAGYEIANVTEISGYRDYLNQRIASYNENINNKINEFAAKLTRSGGYGEKYAALNNEENLLQAMLAAPTGVNNITYILGTSEDILNREFSIDTALLTEYFNSVGVNGSMLDTLEAFRNESRIRRDNALISLNSLINTREIMHQDTELPAYGDAVQTILDAENEAAVDAALPNLRAAAGNALESPLYSEKQIGLDFYNAYDFLVDKNIGKVDYDSPIYTAMQELLSSQSEQLTSLYELRLNGYSQVELESYKKKIEALTWQNEMWQEKVDAIMNRGRAEWESTFTALEKEHTEWVTAFEEEYQAKDRFWNEKYLNFITAKNDWVNKAEANLVKVGSKAVLEELGLDSGQAISEAIKGIATDMAVQVPDMGVLIGNLTGRPILTKTLDFSRLMNKGIRNIGTEVYALLPSDNIIDLGVTLRIAEFQTASSGEISHHSSCISAYLARETVEDARIEMQNEIIKANESIADSIKQTMYQSGFSLSGDNRFTRKVIIGSTVTSNIWEDQNIDGYNYFYKELPKLSDLNIDLSPEKLTNLSSDGINMMIGIAIDKLSGEMNEIMSGENAEFSIHVGEAAEMKDDGCDPGKPIEQNLSNEGSGELGRIFKDFFALQIKENAGLAELHTPFYDKKIYDDRNSLVKSPTIREAVDLAVTIGSLAVPGGPIVGFLLNMADDALFTSLDVANGRMTIDEAGVFLAKKGATTAVTQAFGAGNVKALSGIGTGGLKCVVAKTLFIGASSVAQNAAVGAINSIEYSHDKGWNFNTDNLRESVIGERALIGYATNMAGTAVTAGLSEFNMSSQKLKGLNSVQTTTKLQSFNDMMGTFTEMGLEYALTGETTVNILSVADLAGLAGRKVRKNSGLLELHLGKEETFLKFGKEGHNVSVSELADAAGGIGVMNTNRKIGNYSKKQNVAGTDVALRSLYGFGDEEGQKTLRNILKGTDELKITDEFDNDAKARTSLKEDGSGRIIRIKKWDEDDASSQFMAGIILQHEAYRDGKVNDGNTSETINAVKAHTQMFQRMQGDMAFRKNYGDEAIFSDKHLMMNVMFLSVGETAFARYVGDNYDSSDDYLKFTKKDEKDIDEAIEKLKSSPAEDAARKVSLKELGSVGRKKVIDDYISAHPEEIIDLHKGAMFISSLPYISVRDEVSKKGKILDNETEEKYNSVTNKQVTATAIYIDPSTGRKIGKTVYATNSDRGYKNEFEKNAGEALGYDAVYGVVDVSESYKINENKEVSGPTPGDFKYHEGNEDTELTHAEQILKYNALKKGYLAIIVPSSPACENGKDKNNCAKINLETDYQIKVISPSKKQLDGYGNEREQIRKYIYQNRVNLRTNKTVADYTTFYNNSFKNENWYKEYLKNYYKRSNN